MTFFLMFEISCTRNDYKGLPPSIGGMSELLVVIPDKQWNEELGHTVKELFASTQNGLNQDEPIYKLTQINHKEFKGLFEKNRKVLKIVISDTVNTEQTIAKKDVFASNQLIIEVHAKTESKAIELIKTRFLSLIKMYKDVEHTRITNAFAKTENLKLRQDMIDQFGFYFIMPESFYNAKETNGFAWYRLEHPRYSQCLMVYVREFVDSAQFSLDNIVKYRNKVCKENIPGEISGSYMATDTTFFPKARLLKFKDTKAIELRGLWKTEGDFMGGPFLNYTFLDQDSANVITLEGYVYYPNKEKRDLLMQLESIIYSFRYAKKENTK